MPSYTFSHVEDKSTQVKSKVFFRDMMDFQISFACISLFIYRTKTRQQVNLD